MTDNITLRRAAEQARSAIRVFYNKYSAEAAHEDAGCAIAALDAALAEPPAKPEPATVEQMFAAYNAQASGPQKSTIAFYCDGWQAAERFHNITKEDGK
jgi:hypothetical protein